MFVANENREEQLQVLQLILALADLGLCCPTLPQKKAEGWGTPALLAGQGWGTRRLFGTSGMAEAKP